LGSTCTRWLVVTQDELLWKALTERDFSLPTKSELMDLYDNSYKSYYQYQYYLAHPPKVNAHAPNTSDIISTTQPDKRNNNNSNTNQVSVGPIRSIKLVAVGDPSAKTTELLITYVNSGICPEYVPTVFDNYSVSIVAGGRPYEIALWDIAGTTEYERLRPLSYANANVFLLVFSLVDPITFENIEHKWFPEVEHFCPGVPKLLVGTHAEKRMDAKLLKLLAANGLSPVSTAEGLQLAAKLGLTYYVECSTRSGENVNKVFDLAVKSVLVKSLSHAETKKCIIC
jgi:small GTP-binding protein